MKQINPASVVTSRHSSGMALFHPGSGQLFLSNETGARVWERLMGQKSLDDIAADIGREYRIDRAEARDHVARFVAALEQHRLIEKGVGQ